MRSFRGPMPIWRFRTKQSYVRVLSNKMTAGASFNRNVVLRKASRAAGKDQPYFVHGYRLKPRPPRETRRIEFRVYQQDGRPTHIDMFLQLRDPKGKPKKPAISRFNYPKG
jgi:hypothetical protein